MLSTTMDGKTAKFYAKGGADKSKRGGPAILFEIRQGAVSAHIPHTHRFEDS
jgi:hypothetical protein